jgi:predicted NBD/HSP70 family sugar kinase
VLRVTSKRLPAHSRQHNRSLILQTLFHEGAMSRADLARRSGLTRVTVSDLVNDFSTEGLISDLGERTGAGVGKPGRLISFDSNAYHVISLDLSGVGRFVGAVMGLRGEIIHRAQVPVENATGQAALDKAIDLVRDLSQRASVRLLGIGIGTPGIVDRDGVVHTAPNLGWTDLDLAGAFRAEFDVPVHVGNDANTAALAVHTFGDLRDRDLMLVAIGRGVGVGLIVGGALVEGEQLTAGEIGHVIVDEEGERCGCGRRGCLELKVAVPAIKHRLREADEAEGDEVLAGAGRALGIALAPVIATLGLQQVVLAGPDYLIEGPLLETASRTIKERTLAAANIGLNVTLASHSQDLVLRGATVLVLSRELWVS